MDESEEPRKSLGEKIRRLRQGKGLSQEEFAHNANIDRSYVGQIERGERNLAFSNILKIARALQINIADLMEGID